jgi:uncharacterized protein (UPF0371 family)
MKISYNRCELGFIKEEHKKIEGYPLDLDSLLSDRGYTLFRDHDGVAPGFTSEILMICVQWVMERG